MRRNYWHESSKEGKDKDRQNSSKGNVKNDF